MAAFVDKLNVSLPAVLGLIVREPLISVISKFVVPSTSISPLISSEAKTEVPVAVTVPVTSIPADVVSIFFTLS